MRIGLFWFLLFTTDCTDFHRKKELKKEKAQHETKNLCESVYFGFYYLPQIAPIFTEKKDYKKRKYNTN